MSINSAICRITLPCKTFDKFMKQIFFSFCLAAQVAVLADEPVRVTREPRQRSFATPSMILEKDPEAPPCEPDPIATLIESERSNCECNSCLPKMVLTLEESINRALTVNRQVLTSVSALQGSQLRLEQVFSDYDLKMRPLAKGGYSGGGKGGTGLDIGAGLTWEKRWASGTKILISPYYRRLEHGTQIDLDASLIQPILRGFNREYNLSPLRGAQFTTRTSLRSLHIAQTSMVTKTIITLYEYVKLQKTLEFHRELCAKVKKHYKIIKQKEARELAESSDVFKIESDLIQIEDAIRNTEGKFREVQDTIRELLALDPAQCFDVNVPIAFQNCVDDCDQAIKIALMHRTELDQAQDDYCEKVRLSKVAKRNLLPEVDVVMRYNNTGYDRYFRDIKRRPETTWTINLSTTTDFERINEKISYDQSLVAVQSSLTALDQMREKIIMEVKRSYRTLGRTKENQQIQECKMASLKGELKFNMRKYEKGQIKISDVIKLEQSITSTNIALFSLSVDQIMGEYALKSSMGLLIEKPCLNT